MPLKLRKILAPFLFTADPSFNPVLARMSLVHKNVIKPNNNKVVLESNSVIRTFKVLYEKSMLSVCYVWHVSCLHRDK